MDVDDIASPGKYEITIKGVGADGTEHICKYSLIIMPKIVIDPPINAKISNPSAGQTVSNSIVVKGTSKGKLLDGNHLWLIVGLESMDQWWPQGGNRIKVLNEEWSKEARIGAGVNEDVDKIFQIAVVQVNAKTDQEFVEWVARGRSTGEYPPISLDENAKILDKIDVIKGKS